MAGALGRVPDDAVGADGDVVREAAGGHGVGPDADVGLRAGGHADEGDNEREREDEGEAAERQGAHADLHAAAHAIRMMPGSRGVNRTATSGSWPATTSRSAPASASIVSNPSSISGRLVRSCTGCRVSTLR